MAVCLAPATATAPDDPDRKRLMTKLLAFIRANAIALCALFIALGGTSYAAIAIPRNSVGNSQLRNHAVTPGKLNSSAIGGYVLDWAQIDRAGHVFASRPRGATTTSWNANPGSPGFIGGLISWHHPIPKGCFALASAAGVPTGPTVPASVSADPSSGSASRAAVSVLETEPTTASVAVICAIR